ALKEVLAKSFGLSSLGRGHHRTMLDKQGQERGKCSVELMWYATVEEWWPDTIIMAQAHFYYYRDRDRKNVALGVLLVPLGRNKLEFLGSDPLRSVEIPDQRDPVVEALKNMNLVEPKEGKYIPGNSGLHPRIHMVLYAGNGEGGERELSYE